MRRQSRSDLHVATVSVKVIQRCPLYFLFGLYTIAYKDWPV
jgi:hypothetical protein